MESLLAVAGGPMFEHRAAQLRQDRVSAQARAEAAAAYAERGFTILDERPPSPPTPPRCCCVTCVPPMVARPP